jgi:hypothetical protein
MNQLRVNTKILGLFFSGALIAFLGASAHAEQSVPSAVKFEKGISHLHNQRYCEVLYGKRNWLSLEVKVFNTQGLNDCPEDQWRKITKEALEKSIGASFVMLNGPRYWMMDEILAAGNTANDIRQSFGGMEMSQRAVVKLSLMQQVFGRKFYKPNEITRTTNFIYKTGTRVYELTAPSGEVYVMQSYSQIINPQLSIDDLPKLGQLLKLPSGWVYSSRVLTQDLSLIAQGAAYVLQDDLENSYQRR